MPTVAQEMSPEERRERLVKALKATGEDEVVMNFSQVAHAIGMDEAEKLIKGKLVEMHGILPSRTSRQNKLNRKGMVVVDRLAALEAMNKKSIDSKMQGKS